MGFATLKGVVSASLSACFLIALVALVPLVAHAAVGDTTLVSRGAAAGNGDSGPGLAVNADGRYIAFESKAANLDPAAKPGVTNIYKRDTKTGTTTLVTRLTGADGAGADGDSAAPAISPAGRFVAFESDADTLSPDDDQQRSQRVRPGHGIRHDDAGVGGVRRNGRNRRLLAPFDLRQRHDDRLRLDRR